MVSHFVATVVQVLVQLLTVWTVNLSRRVAASKKHMCQYLWMEG